ncbi:iron-sulfur cluster repair di-iron protein [Paenibacillus sp. NFR01]|uniref:iron-sulfur cluster repair di-iron protein n=1 Tax=Paenibacillus sp. NFR01 TaxID=1566279 RepID=UPI0008C1AC33|nr:iron-sulfur cluster repair di-iron protein [Paenibacillus sp. NFR01]SET59226.1 regulator of cell morphogenesis and NO signaling [Paenibacillus sp. NFR01]
MTTNHVQNTAAELQFTGEELVRDIVLKFPKSADYFKSKRIDFCCGGAKPLAEVTAEKDMNTEAVLEDLHELAKNHPVLESDTAWVGASSQELIDFIVNKHHHYLREELPLIAQNVTKVFRVHGEDSPHLAEMYRLFHLLREDLLKHTAQEEETEFPKMLAYEAQPTADGLNELRGLLRGLEEEHDGAGEILRELRRITNDYTPPEHACTTYRLTYARLEELEGMTFEHVHLENNILFLRYQ